MNRLCANDLNAEEVAKAHEMLQAGALPEQVIQKLRGELATLLDPPQFPINIQRRVQELLTQRRRGSAT